MRLLHTSDWHVGKSIRGLSRADEHRAVLAEMVAIAVERAVDVFVVAGDLFESSAPSPEAEAIVYEALLSLSARDIQVLVISGNHDNARRFEAIRPILALARVHVVARPTTALPRLRCFPLCLNEASSALTS
jgi:exonuclease SbcD